MARSSSGVSALSRALAVLDVFGVDTPYLTLTEISRRAELPLSSAHGIVQELASHGLLERMEDRSYRLGNRVWELGTRTPGALGLREIALPHLQALHAQVRQHAQLMVRIDLDVLVIERLSARDAVVSATIVGGRIPLQHSSCGLVLLADAGEEAVEAVLRRGLQPPTSAAIQDGSELRAAIERTRRLGYAVASGFIYAGSRGIAVPVRGSEDVVVGAVGLVVPNDDAPVSGHVALLRRSADAISESLRRSYLPPGHPRALPGGSYRRMVNSSESSMAYLQRRRPAKERRR
ncbi:IclR family transcriptional regulator [Georgenia halophila]|uniref:IclR family transcriptional regulator n=1 Tax=Georgenia halophila TaxID=620889 RepID=A0ABP8KSY7_9MICO